MNWYKLAQQQSFDFWHEDQRNNYLDKRPELATPQLDEGYSFKEMIEQCSSAQELQNILTKFASNYERITFENGVNVISAIIEKDLVLVTGEEGSYSVEDPNEWINDINSRGDAEDYITPYDEFSDFWNGVSGSFKLYHGTSEDNLALIMKQGLKPSYGTRGMTNRMIGDAIFMSPEEETAGYYYPHVIEIDVGAMKRDKYMPEVGGEDPLKEGEALNAIANKIGLDNYEYQGDTSDGLSEDTVIFYGEIPPKYLKVIK